MHPQLDFFSGSQNVAPLATLDKWVSVGDAGEKHQRKRLQKGRAGEGARPQDMFTQLNAAPKEHLDPLTLSRARSSFTPDPS